MKSSRPPLHSSLSLWAAQSHVEHEKVEFEGVAASYMRILDVITVLGPATCLCAHRVCHTWTEPTPSPKLLEFCEVLCMHCQQSSPCLRNLAGTRLPCGAQPQTPLKHEKQAVKKSQSFTATRVLGALHGNPSLAPVPFCCHTPVVGPLQSPSTISNAWIAALTTSPARPPLHPHPPRAPPQQPPARPAPLVRRSHRPSAAPESRGTTCCGGPTRSRPAAQAAAQCARCSGLWPQVQALAEDAEHDELHRRPAYG